MSFVVNHLWQSTLFAGGALLLVVGLRRSPARLRHAIWLAASLKFLIPFAGFVALGQQLAQLVPPVSRAIAAPAIVEAVSQPFSPTAFIPAASPVVAPSSPQRSGNLWPALLVLWPIGSALIAGHWLVRWRRMCGDIRRGAPLTDGREIEMLRRLEARPGHLDRLELVRVSQQMEPGLFGWVRPVLIWPDGLAARFTDDQLEAVLAHELSHLRRRDNLTAAVHMAVQAIFWFHPLVWWMGARLVAEREHACDEDVVRGGARREAYAESLLETCRHCLESPLACVPGVTGADLKQRIASIMTMSFDERLTRTKKIVLLAATMVVTAAPLAIGVLAAQSERQIVPTPPDAPAFEVVSVKPNNAGANIVMVGSQPGGRFVATNVPLRLLIRNAYQIQDSQLIGGPGWISSDRFDVTAKMPAEFVNLPPLPPGSGPGPQQLMLRAMLAERFKLVTRIEPREVAAYALVVARKDQLGPSLKPSTVDCQALETERRRPGATPPAPPAPGERPICGMRVGNAGPRDGSRGATSTINAGAVSIAQLIQSLSPMTQRMVVDRTGLIGRYDIDLSFTPDRTPATADPNAAAPLTDQGPSLFTAVQDQLGLKLESTKARVDVLVIESVERPTPD